MTDALSRIKGAFALIIHDAAEERVIAARDREVRVAAPGYRVGEDRCRGLADGTDVVSRQAVTRAPSPSSRLQECRAKVSLHETHTQCVPAFVVRWELSQHAHCAGTACWPSYPRLTLIEWTGHGEAVVGLQHAGVGDGHRSHVLQRQVRTVCRICLRIADLAACWGRSSCCITASVFDMMPWRVVYESIEFLQHVITERVTSWRVTYRGSCALLQVADRAGLRRCGPLPRRSGFHLEARRNHRLRAEPQVRSPAG